MINPEATKPAAIDELIDAIRGSDPELEPEVRTAAIEAMRSAWSTLTAWEQHHAAAELGSWIAPPQRKTFELGERVTAQSAGDSDCVWTFEVIHRSRKFITLRETSGELNRVGVLVDSDGAEWARPFGSYSLAPIVRPGR